MSNASERIDLDAFLNGLSDADRGEARAAAAKIDKLARIGDRMTGIERHFRWPAIVAAGMMMLGVWLFVHPMLLNRWLMVFCISALPIVGVVYAWRVRDRTRADNEIEALNRDYFLPHGGLYFPPGDRPACVVRVTYSKPLPELPISRAPRDPRKHRDIYTGRPL